MYYVVVRLSPKKQEMFSFQTKKQAVSFTKDLSKKYPDVEWAISERVKKGK